MNKKGIICIIILMAQAIYIGCNSNHSSNSDSGTEEQWVTVSGKVVYLDDPQSALVLVNGQSMFTNSDDGIFEIEALLDETGTLTLNVFVSGMAPYEQTVRPPETTDLIVSMSQPAPDSSEMSLIAEIWPVDGDKVKIEGNVSFGGLPLHAMVIANEQHVFSNSENGSFRMVVMPTEEYEQIRIMCFSDGFIPYEETILPVKIEVVAHATSYGTVELSGTTQTISLHQVSLCDFYHCQTYSYVGEAPIGATIDADDYQSVSDESDGTFEIEIPYDSSETIIILASILEGIHYGAVIAPEEVIPWQYLSASPAEMDLLLDTTEIAYIEGGQAPFQVSSTNPSIATASIQGRIVTIAGLSEGDATVAITDSESFVVQIAISVSSEGIGQAVWVPVKEEKDIGGNGVVNKVTYYTYDSNGLLREVVDYDND
ncbi:MAG: hypothetical protein GY706_09285, partial [Bacteroides sp.]|nr:hypothetical protein [Bacteroides sp.]